MPEANATRQRGSDKRNAARQPASHGGQTTRALPFAGFGLTIGLLQGLLLSNGMFEACGLSRSANDALSLSLIVSFSLACLAQSALHALTPGRGRHPRASLTTCAVVGCLLGLLLAILAGTTGLPIVLLIAGVPLGAGLSALWIAWLEEVRRAQPGSSGKLLCTACVAASAVGLALVIAPSVASLAIAFGCPVISGVLLVMTDRSQRPEPDGCSPESAGITASGRREKRQGQPSATGQTRQADQPDALHLRACVSDLLAPFFCMLAVSFAFGAVGQVALVTPAGPEMATLVTSGAMVVAALLFTIVASAFKVFDAPEDFFRLIFPVLLGLLFLLPFLSERLQVVVNGCIVAIYWLMLFAFMLVVVALSRREDLGSAPVSGVTLGVSYLINLLGVWFGTLVGDSGYGFVQLAVIAFVSGYALVAALLFLWRREKRTGGALELREPGGEEGTGLREGTIAPEGASASQGVGSSSPQPSPSSAAAGRRGQATPSDSGDIDWRCAQLAEANGLTARETEVLSLLAKGRSGTYISEKLCVSKNTTKGHVKAIYSKLGVHTRQELIDQRAISEF